MQVWLSAQRLAVSRLAPDVSMEPSEHKINTEQLQYTVSFRNRKGKIRTPMRPMKRISVSDLPDLFQENEMLSSNTAVVDVSKLLSAATIPKRITLQTLHNAGIKELDEAVYGLLPTDSAIAALYGDKPVILGFERCETYRSSVPPHQRYAGSAGMFNTGTTALTMYLEANIPSHVNWTGVEFEHRHEVPWGKHRLFDLSSEFTNKGADHLDKLAVLPIVITRDPFFWFQSMCQAPYMAVWKHNKSLHCPNILSTRLDVEQFSELRLNQPIPVTLMAQRRSFDSLAHLWNEWYSSYVESKRPRLLIRQEDLVYHPRQVMEAIRDCIGASSFTKGTLTYVVGRSKWNQEHVKHQSSMVSSMIKYALAGKRFSNMTLEEIQYADRLVGQTMDLFQYKRDLGL
jgi:hypothetical protein